MRQQKLLRTLAALCAMLLPISESKAGDALPKAFAGDISDFVDKKVPELSRKKVSADLGRKWNDFYLAVLIEAAGASAKVAADHPDLSDLPDPSTADVSASVRALARIDMAMAWNRGATDRMSRLERGINNSKLVCGDPRVHSTGAIADIGLQSVLGGLVPGRPQVIIAWDPTWWSTVVSVLYDIFVPGVWYEDQRSKAEAAIRRYPQKVVQLPEIAAISLKACNDTYGRSSQALDAAATEVHTVISTLGSDAVQLLALRPRYEAVLVTKGYIARITQTGVLDSVTAADRRDLTAGTGERLDYVLNDLHALERSFGQLTCERHIDASEQIVHSANSVRMQLAAYVRIVGSSQRLTDADSELSGLQSRSQGWLDALRKKPC